MLVRELMCSLSAHSKRRQCGGVAPADRRSRRRHAGILTQPSLDGDSRIVFTGYLDGEDRIGALAASDIFALPATGEGQPLAALEAMAASLPLVLSPGCNMDEVAAAGAGYVVNPSVDAFAEMLRTLLTDEEMRRKLGGKARQLAEERYSWDKIAERLEAVYTQLL